MGEIVIHAGRTNTGTTSIQRMLFENLGLLERCGTVVAAPVAGGDGDPLVGEWRSDRSPLEWSEVLSRAALGTGRMMRELLGVSVGSAGIAAAEFVASFPRYPGLPSVEVLDRLCAELGHMADRADRVILSVEALDRFLFDDDACFSAFNRLASRHRVRLCMYVSPQDVGLEREWRHFGFRYPFEPAEWVARAAQCLDYAELVDRANRVAPAVECVVRPFRRDLLVGGSSVQDFAAEVLRIGIPEVEAEPAENRGLPLDLVVALREAPPLLIGAGLLGLWNRFERIAAIEGIAGAPSDRSLRSRMVLSAFAYRTFRDSNRRLMARLGRADIEFVEDPGIDDWSLDELDVLWRPSADRAELEILYAALIAATE